MQRMEARIPELAGSAFKLAYWQALTISGTVMEARHGELVETTAEGTVRVIRSIAKPTPVENWNTSNTSPAARWSQIAWSVVSITSG